MERKERFQKIAELSQNCEGCTRVCTVCPIRKKLDNLVGMDNENKKESTGDINFNEIVRVFSLQVPDVQKARLLGIASHQIKTLTNQLIGWNTPINFEAAQKLGKKQAEKYERENTEFLQQQQLELLNGPKPTKSKCVPHRKVTKEEEELMLYLHNEGFGIYEISKRVGRQYTVVKKRVQKWSDTRAKAK